MSERPLRAAIAAVALTGAALAGYLVSVHYGGAPLACTSGGCETVQTSRYAELLGVPVAVFGLLAYLTVLGSALGRSELSCAVGVSVAIAGVSFGAYLLYVQLALIHALCAWCIGSDIVMSVLAALALLRVIARPNVGVSRNR